MPDIDPNLIGAVINAIPIEKMVAAPLMAAIKAQVAASSAFADFLMTVCIKDGQAVLVQFDYEETLLNTAGEATGVQKKTIRAPLMSVIPLPSFGVETVDIQFELSIHQAASESSETAVEAGLEGSLGWGPFSVKVHASVSHKAQQTRSTDTTAKYSFQVKGSRQPPPESLMKIIDTITNAQTKATISPKNKDPQKPDVIETSPSIYKPGVPTATPARR